MLLQHKSSTFLSKFPEVLDLLEKKCIVFHFSEVKLHELQQLDVKPAQVGVILLLRVRVNQNLTFVLENLEHCKLEKPARDPLDLLHGAVNEQFLYH